MGALQHAQKPVYAHPEVESSKNHTIIFIFIFLCVCEEEKNVFPREEIISS